MFCEPERQVLPSQQPAHEAVVQTQLSFLHSRPVEQLALHGSKTPAALHTWRLLHPPAHARVCPTLQSGPPPPAPPEPPVPPEPPEPPAPPPTAPPVPPPLAVPPPAEPASEAFKMQMSSDTSQNASGPHPSEHFRRRGPHANEATNSPITIHPAFMRSPESCDKSRLMFVGRDFRTSQRRKR